MALIVITLQDLPGNENVDISFVAEPKGAPNAQDGPTPAQAIAANIMTGLGQLQPATPPEGPDAA